jgi:queuosine precursor transporter
LVAYAARYAGCGKTVAVRVAGFDRHSAPSQPAAKHSARNGGQVGWSAVSAALGSTPRTIGGLRVIGFLAFVGFILTVPAANWLIGNVGTVCIPDGPCLVPVAPGLMAPSGVLMIGAALVLRDLVQERLGAGWSIIGILIGAALAGFVSPLPLVVASVAAFLISELADLAVYTPLRERRLWLAVIASGIVGAAIDSAIFLQLAFGSLDHIAGNTVGKVLLSVAAIPLIAMVRKRHPA